MVCYKVLVTLYIASLLQVNEAQSQGYGSYAHYGSYFVPYSQEATSGPVRYIPVQQLPSGNNGPTYFAQEAATSYYDQNPSNGLYSPNWANPPTGSYSQGGLFNPPIYSNTPTVSYQGLDEANALRSAYPNQPIIIINNGGNGDTGGNSNNGNNNGKRDDSGFSFGDLAAIFLATKHHGREGGRLRPEGPEIEDTPPPISPQRVNTRINNAFNDNAGANDGNSKCSTVTHITIILPNSGGSVSVEEKKKNGKKKSKPKKKDEEEDNEKSEKNEEKELSSLEKDSVDDE